MKISGQRFLLAYSSILSTGVAFMLLTGAKSSGPQTFDEIQAHRIDIVEPDGTLRMVISGKARLPGVIVNGKEQPKVDRPQAGMIFYNDEGSENGGLIFGGRKNENGEVVDSGGSLSFDKYGASDIVQLALVDDNQIASQALRSAAKTGVSGSDGRPTVRQASRSWTAMGEKELSCKLRRTALRHSLSSMKKAR